MTETINAAHSMSDYAKDSTFLLSLFALLATGLLGLMGRYLFDRLKRVEAKADLQGEAHNAQLERMHKDSNAVASSVVQAMATAGHVQAATNQLVEKATIAINQNTIAYRELRKQTGRMRHAERHTDDDEEAVPHT